MFHNASTNIYKIIYCDSIVSSTHDHFSLHSVIQSAVSPMWHTCTDTVQSFDSLEYVCFFDCICVCAPPPLICLSRPHACPHASTSHTLALGRSGSTRDVPAKSSSTSSLDPNTCNTKPWQPPTSHYQSYSIYRRYSSLHRGTSVSTPTCPLWTRVSALLKCLPCVLSSSGYIQCPNGYWKRGDCF